MLTLLLSDNLPRILDDNLIWFECSVAANAVTSILCLDHLDADVIFAALFDSLLQELEVSVSTLFLRKTAVAAVTFVIHVSVHTILVTASLWCAHTQ